MDGRKENSQGKKAKNERKKHSITQLQSSVMSCRSKHNQRKFSPCCSRSPLHRRRNYFPIMKFISQHILWLSLLTIEIISRCRLPAIIYCALKAKIAFRKRNFFLSFDAGSGFGFGFKFRTHRRRLHEHEN